MSKHIGILISPDGEEFYDAYGPMTKLRDRATRFAGANIATRAANHRYGRHSDAFWNGERASRDRAAIEYRGWTSRTEEVDDGDAKREGHFVTDYVRGGMPEDRLYATRADNGTIGWSRDLGACTLWPEHQDALGFIQSLPRPEGRAYSIEAY